VHGAASFGSILGPDASRVILGRQNRRLAASVLSIKALGTGWDTPMLPDDNMLTSHGSAD